MRRLILFSSALVVAALVTVGSAGAQETSPVSGEAVLGVQAVQLPRTGGLDAALLAPFGFAAAAAGLGLRARRARR
jgi:hypothetical protein